MDLRVWRVWAGVFALATAFFGLFLGSPDVLAQGVRPRVPGAALVAPVVIDGDQKGPAWVFPNADRSKFWVSVESLEALLSSVLVPPKLEEIRKETNGKDVISLAELERLGIRAEFDEKLLQVRLEIPNAIRKPNQFDFAPSRLGPLIGSSKFSGYVNLRGGLFEEFGPDRSSDRPFRGSTDFAVNTKGLVFQGGYEYYTDQPTRWRRLDTRFTYDWPDRLLRGTVGDFDAVVTGFQSPLNLGGVSLAMNYQLQPYESARPRTRTQIEIRRPSNVDVIINGIPFTRLRVAPGVLDLTRLPLVNGNNRIRLVVSDDFGDVQTIDLDYLFDPSLMSEGRQEFAYQFGFPWRTIQVGDLLERAYETDRPTASFFHRYGLTRELTLGSNLQADNDQNMFEVAPVFLTPIGLMEVDVGRSFSASVGSDWATRWRYRSTEFENGTPREYLFRAGLEYRGARFSSVTNEYFTGLNPYSWTGDVQVQKRISYALTAGIGVSHSFKRDEGDDRQVYFADLSWSVRNNLQVGLNLSRTEDSRTEDGVMFTLTWQDPSCCNSAIARYDSLNQSSRIDLEQRPKGNLGFSALGAWEHRPLSDSGSLAAFYRGYRGEVGLRGDSRFNAPSSGLSDQYTGSLNAGTAVVWTENAIALSRPVSDSFVIFPARGQLARNSTFDINRTDSGSYARSDWWGPGVVPDVAAYYERPVSIDTAMLPAGVRLKRENVTAKPSYRSGVEVPIEIQSFISVRGSMTDPAGAPLSLAAGEVREAATDRYVSSFFTNRKGKFLLEGLEAGRYKLVFFEGNWKTVEVEVPTGKIGTYQLNQPLMVGKE